MAVKNKTARMIIAAFELKKLNAEEEAKKTFLRAFDADDAEEVVDALENAEEENIDDVDDADLDDDNADDIDASDDNDGEDNDEEELTDEEVLEEVEARVSELKAAAKLKARKKFLD